MPTSRGFAALGIIIALVIAALAGGYWYSSRKGTPVLQPTETAPSTETVALKTYTDTQYGFSFEYPAASPVSLVDHVMPHGTDIMLPGGLTGNDDFVEKDGSVGDPRDFEFLIFKSAVPDLETRARDYGHGHGTFTHETVGGQPAYHLQTDVSAAGLNYVFVQDSQHVLMFVYPNSNAKAASSIISSFRFTN